MLSVNDVKLICSKQSKLSSFFFLTGAVYTTAVMISIDQYRISVGCFASVAMSIFSNLSRFKGMTPEEKVDFFHHFKHAYLNHLKYHILFSIGIYQDILRVIMRLLLLSNDIETNPGPLFTQCVQGSLHQGSSIFGRSAGLQSSVISLCALAFLTIIKQSSDNLHRNLQKHNCWKGENIDNIIVLGDALFKSFRKDTFVGIEELPQSFNILDTQFKVEFTVHQNGIFRDTDRSVNDFKSQISSSCLTNSGFLLWFSQTCVSIMLDQHEHGHTDFLLFDTHSRSRTGKVVDNGTAVLLRFATLTNLMIYLSETYLEDFCKHNIPYEIQFVKLTRNYQFSKAISASLNQGDAIFGETAGKQCCAISLFALCYSLITRRTFWKASTLDKILHGGNDFYRSLQKNRFLYVEDLPTSFAIDDATVHLDLLYNSYGILSVNNEDLTVFRSHILSNISGSTGFLLFLHEYCVSVTTSFRNRDKQNIFILFDSHSRNVSGQVDANGTAILLTFENLANLTSYLCHTYVHHDEGGKVPYQVQFVSCLLEMPESQHHTKRVCRKRGIKTQSCLLQKKGKSLAILG